LTERTFGAKVVPTERRGPMTARWEIYKDEGGKYRWRLRAANSRIVASSGESFVSKYGAEMAILIAQRAATTTVVVEADS
jgi:uncharacterized protein YegP (UPF0339 family)